MLGSILACWDLLLFCHLNGFCAGLRFILYFLTKSYLVFAYFFKHPTFCLFVVYCSILLPLFGLLWLILINKPTWTCPVMSFNNIDTAVLNGLNKAITAQGPIDDKQVWETSIINNSCHCPLHTSQISQLNLTNTKGIQHCVPLQCYYLNLIEKKLNLQKTRYKNGKMLFNHETRLGTTSAFALKLYTLATRHSRNEPDL